MEPTEHDELYEFIVDENLDPNSGYSFIPIGYCGVFYRELHSPEARDQPLYESWIMLENIVGSSSPDAPLKQRIAHFMCTQCPADKYTRIGTKDQVMRWAELRNDYIAIANCFLAIDSDYDPLQKRLEDPEDSMNKWGYKQIWTDANIFQLLYEVLVEKWGLLSAASADYSKENKNAFKIQLPRCNLYEFFEGLLEEVSDKEIQSIFEPFYEDRPGPYSRLVKLNRQELENLNNFEGEKPGTTSPDKIWKLLQKLRQSQKKIDLFLKLWVIWESLAPKDPWLAEKLIAYRSLLIELLKGEQRANYYQFSIGHNRPSETWHNGKVRSNARGTYNKQ